MPESLPRHARRTSFRVCVDSPAVRWTIRAVLAAASVGLLVAALRAADLRRAVELISASPGLWLVPLPAALGAVADAEAWRRLAAASGEKVSLEKLVRTRLSAEAIAVTLPLGSAFAEGTALYLLSLRPKLPAGPVVATLASRRLHIAFAHGVMLGTAGLTGLVLAKIGSSAVIGGAAAWISMGAAAVLIAFTMLAPRLLLRGTVARRYPGLRSLLRRTGTPGRRPLSPVTALYAVMWITESLESFLIVRLLGGSLSLPAVFSFDALVTMVRSIAVFSPAGLGFQEAGYMAFLAPMGGATLATAFVLVKRGREVAFAAVGYLLLILGEVVSGRPGELAARSAG